MFCGLIFAYVYLIIHTYFAKIVNQHPDIQVNVECLWNISKNANEEVLTGNADASYPDADPDPT